MSEVFHDDAPKVILETLDETYPQELQPNSERFEELPGIRFSLIGEDSEGREVVARLGKVKMAGKECSCGCGHEFMIGGESVLTRILGPGIPEYWNRYTSAHFQPIIDTWQKVRTIPSDKTTDKALDQHIRKKERKAQQADYEEQIQQRERASRNAQRRYIAANGHVWLSNGPKR